MSYRSFAYSEKGARHEKDNMPCQDSAMEYMDMNLPAVIVAAADGHGSEECFRSGRGAHFAVECAIECIKKFICTIRTIRENNISASFIATESIESKQEKSQEQKYLMQLSNSIITDWNKKVEEDYANEPFGLPEYIELAYGTTLMAAAITDDYWFGLQIGDGKCVVLSDDGIFSQPIPADEKCFMNITTSMCDCDASHEFRYYFGTDIPSAIFIGTDGVDNSLKDDVQLYELYRRITGDFAAKGFDEESAEIKRFLPMLTKKGSGDDISIAGIIKIL